ncbi:MAG: hypothetical protein QX189_04815 [Methylococcales bacterium]
MFNELYEKYKATDYQGLSAINPLNFILRKAELGLDLTASEWDWLDKNQLIETKEIIKNQENYRDSLRKEVRLELFKLRKNQFVHSIVTIIPAIDSEIALTLYRLHVWERFTNNFVSDNYLKLLDFNDTKQKYGITEDIPFGTIAEALLAKLEKQTPFSATDTEWLCTHNAYSFLTPLQNQFSQLQNKYKAIVQVANTYSPLMLCHILQKLDENTLLNEVEISYLKAAGLTETLEIVQKMEFFILKEKYHATQIQEDNITNHLFKVLKKLEAGLPLPEPDINYLKKRKLFETVKCAYQKEANSLIDKINQGLNLTPDDIAWCEQHDFKELISKWRRDGLNRKIEQGQSLKPEDVAWCEAHQSEDIVFKWLKNGYGINHRQDTLNTPLYAILKKLHAGNRLTDDDVVWLESEDLLTPATRKIYLAHHALKARFHENEFLRTKDHWKLASASAHWRKAEKPQQALKQTNDLNFKKIKPAKLAAALLTTRGGALRDIDRLSEAEQCALEAIKYFPDSHNPYTLMGALCYDTGRYGEGDEWFEKAVKRGAKPQDQDAEIRRILLKKKDQERKELIDYLLKKDSYRFAWVRHLKP